MAGAKSEGDRRGWRPSGGSEPVRRGARPEWIPTPQQPKSRARRYKQIALALAGIGIIAFGVWLYYLLLPPSPPVLLIITTDPAADATDLGAPIDPYGWHSGKALEKWSKQYEAAASDAEKKHVPKTSNGSDVLKNNETIKTVEDLASWAVGEARHSGSFKKPSETAIIYFGLHTGADAKGAFLFANKGRRFYVKELLKAISEQMGETKVLVLFDPGRLLPDPAHGQLTDGFVDGVKVLNDEIAGYRNLTVILGCDSGERGWESEELQRTAFAHAVIQGLGGKASPSKDNNVTGRDLFEFVKKETEEWTRRNRPSIQHPIMLPTSDTGMQRAGGTELTPHHDLPDDPPPAPPDVQKELWKQWRVYGELADLRVDEPGEKTASTSKGPGPEVYSPRHWRRYRDLLLRYEFVVRAGEENSKAKLDTELKTEANAIRTARDNPVINLSTTASTPMWQASGKEPALGSPTELRAAGNQYFLKPGRETLQDFTDKLAKQPSDRIIYSREVLDQILKDRTLVNRGRLLRELWTDRPVHPPDAQLFLMLDRFYGQLVLGENLPEEIEKGVLLWQRALQVRRIAEEAALGPATSAHPYSDVVWRSVQAVVLDGDRHRRRAEDLLFAPAGPDRAAAFGHLDKAEDQYRRAVKRATELRTALALRDQVFADLPYLGRWSVFDGDEKFNTDARSKLATSTHDLARRIDKLSPEPADSGTPAIMDEYRELLKVVEAVTDGHDRLVKEYKTRFEDESKQTDVKLQKTWLERERLLAVPPLKFKDSLDSLSIRAKLIAVNRAATAYFLDPRNTVGIAPSDEAKNRANVSKDRAIALGFLGMHELGDDLIDKQARTSNTNFSWEAIKNEINKIAESGKWEDAASSGERIGRHYRTLADTADPLATDAKAADAERFSRVAVTFVLRNGSEPAEVNRKFRWQRLLFAQAQRAVHDHWYDGDKPYFRDVAEAYLRDAEALTPSDPKNSAEKLGGHDLKTLLDLNDTRYQEFESLKNAGPLKLQAEASDGPWTTEAKKNIRFRLEAGAIPAEAKPVAWAAFDPLEKPGREVVFAPGAEARRLTSIKTGLSPLPVAIVTPDTAKSVHDNITVRRSAFFRGQHIPANAELALNRMPDLVYTHVRAQPTDLPRVSFVGPNDIDVGAVTIVIDYSPSMYEKSKNPDEKTRIERMWVELEKILKDLPDGTRLTVRGFGVAPEDKQKVEAEEFESATTRGGIDKEDITKTKYPGTYDRRVQEPYTVNWAKNPGNLSVLMNDLKTAKLAQPEDRGLTNSPVVRTVVRASRKDFEGVKEHQTKVLIVLTDGADNSSWDYSGKEPKLNFNPLMRAMEKEFKEGKGQGVTVRMLLINDSDTNEKDGTLTKEFQKRATAVLDSLEPPGSVLVGEVKELGKELADLLRPRVRLTHEDAKTTETLKKGIAIRFDKPTLERPEWSGMPSLGEYEAWVGRKPALEDRQTLRFTPADHLMIGLSRPKPEEPVQFRRVVWGHYRSFGEELKKANRQQEKLEQKWLMSAVMYRGAISGYEGENITEKGRKILDLSVAVENVDPERLQSKPLRQIVPDFVWWELNEDPTTKLGIVKAPIHVWREYGHPAPVWRIRRYGWADQVDNMLPKSTLRGWVEQREKALKPQQTTSLTDLTAESAAGANPDGTAWTEKWKDDSTDGKKWIATFAWEEHTFATNPDLKEPERPRMCLVVRVYQTEQKPGPILGRPAPYFVQVDGTRVEEHRYFRDVGAYTGYFYFGSSSSPESALKRNINLFSAADLTDPKVGVDFTLTLPRASSDGSDPVWNVWEQYTPKKP